MRIIFVGSSKNKMFTDFWKVKNFRLGKGEMRDKKVLLLSLRKQTIVTVLLPLLPSFPSFLLSLLRYEQSREAILTSYVTQCHQAKGVNAATFAQCCNDVTCSSSDCSFCHAQIQRELYEWIRFVIVISFLFIKKKTF